MKFSGKLKKLIDSSELCTNCPVKGNCCRYHFVFEDHKIMTRHACKYLNERTNMCRIYDQCHEINKNCMPLKEALLNGELPEKCPYVKIVGYPEGVSPKIDYLPDDMTNSGKFNWRIFNASHRDFVRKYFNERLSWHDFTMAIDKLLERLRDKINKI